MAGRKCESFLVSRLGQATARKGHCAHHHRGPDFLASQRYVTCDRLIIHLHLLSPGHMRSRLLPLGFYRGVTGPPHTYCLHSCHKAQEPATKGVGLPPVRPAVSGHCHQEGRGPPGSVRAWASGCGSAVMAAVPGGPPCPTARLTTSSRLSRGHHKRGGAGLCPLCVGGAGWLSIWIWQLLQIQRP